MTKRDVLTVLFLLALLVALGLAGHSDVVGAMLRAN